MSTANYEALAGVPLTKGITTGQAINPASNYDQDIITQNWNTLVVEVDMTAGAAGDLVVSLFPFEGDNFTVMPIAIPPANSVGPSLSGGHDYYYGEFDVSSLDKARIRITNNNAGTQTINRWSWRLQ